MRTIVLDTNVLLADPGVLFAFPDARLIIPETVLGELDKLKTSRVDPDLRFRGREVSRMLFELSEQGSLIKGVELPDGGTLRVVPFDADAELPEGLTARSPDDRILAVAHQVCSAECDELTMITNDLNMLLKAQTLGLDVERHGDGIEGSFGRRYIIRPFQRYRIPLTILAISLAVFAAVVAVAIWTTTSGTQRSAGIPQEFEALLTPQQSEVLDYLVTLQSEPNNAQALLAMGNVYLDLRDQTGNLSFARLATSYYERYLAIDASNPDARTDLAISYFYLGQTDRAIQEVGKVLEQQDAHLQANYNLGVFYWRGREDYAGAASQFQKVLELAPEGDTTTAAVRDQAATSLERVREEAEAAGQPLPVEGTF